MLMSRIIISRFPKEVNRKMTDNNDFDFIVLSTLLAVLILIAVVTYYSLHPETEDFLPELKGEPIIETIFEEETTIEQLAINEEVEVKKPILSDTDMIAIVVYNEARGEEMVGKTAVAAVVLNRCEYYNATIETIVTQPNQFSYDPNVKPDDSCYRAVQIAMENRDLFPKNMMYFRNQHYHVFGEPYLQIGKHFFSCRAESEE